MSYVGVILPELISDFDELEKLIKSMNKLREKASIVAFLIPDDTYEVLQSLLEQRDYELNEYSARKWLTGIIPEPDKFFLSKVHILLHRGDVFKVSDVLKDCKEFTYSNIECYKSDKIILLGNNDSAEKLLEMNIDHSIQKLKGVRDILLIRLI